MSEKDTAGRRDFSDNLILLDSNVIVSLFTKFGQRQYDTDLQLLMAAVTCENFLILENTVQELYGFAARQKSNIDPMLANYSGVEYLQFPSDFD